VPGLNHQGLVQALYHHSQWIRYADPVVYFAFPQFPGVGSRQTLNRVAGLALEQLKDAPFRRIFPRPGQAGTERSIEPFQWADVLAGDIGAIRRYAPADLHHKTVVVLSASEEDMDDLRRRGVSIAVTLIPDLRGTSRLAGWGAATVEAVLASVRPSPESPLIEDTYLDLIADLDWKPDIRFLQPEEAGINRFAFVIHPLNATFIHQYKWFRWTRFFPNSLVEAVAAWIPPLYLSRIVCGKSPTTGQRIEGYLFALGATPRQMMQHGERFTYARLNKAARMAERRGARIMGLGAFTSVIGDAGVTVAHEADIAITSGNSLTVAATLEAAKQAMIKMGTQDLTRGKAMVIGATGSIGAVCARLLAQAIHDVVLVSIEPEKLIELKRRIQTETQETRVTIATHADEKEIYHLFKKHDFQLAGLRSFGKYLQDDILIQKRNLADRMRADPQFFAQIRDQAAAQLEKIPVMAKGVLAEDPVIDKKAILAAGIGLLGWFALRRMRAVQTGKTT
jgi:hypothetical protein